MVTVNEDEADNEKGGEKEDTDYEAGDFRGCELGRRL
jgi:hypothetical protein